jgi:DNA-binding GntR family transcriptional regulator
MSLEGIFQPRERRVLSRDVYEALRDAILDGRLQPGERLVESTLAKEMHISRAPIREAIRQLEGDGLVEVIAQRESRVVSLTAQDIEELHLIRAALEILAYQYASRYLMPDEVSSLEDLLAKMERAARNRDTKTLATCDFEFHLQLCRAARLSRLYHLWYDQHVLFRLWLNVVAKAYEHDRDMMATAAGHRAILEAVKARDDRSIVFHTFTHIYRLGQPWARERAQWAEKVAWLYGLRPEPFTIAPNENTRDAAPQPLAPGA